MIEQLKYTWADSGREGYCKYQIVAASKHTLDFHDPVLKSALDLCRYDMPIGRSLVNPPVSFGWQNRDGMRFAFCRRFRQDAQFGHPGNFSAHILFGPLEELDIETLIKSFNTDFWWVAKDSDYGDVILPFLSSDDIPQNESPLMIDRGDEDDRAATLLNGLLIGKKPLMLPVSPAELVEVLLAVSRSVPHMINALSFSTYESSIFQNNFDVLCSSNESQYPSEKLIYEDIVRAIIFHPAMSRAVDEKVYEWNQGSYRHDLFIEGMQFMVDMINGKSLGIEAMMKHVMLRNPEIFNRKMNAITFVRKLNGSLSKIHDQMQTKNSKT